MAKKFNSSKLNNIINELLESVNKSKNKATKFQKAVLERISNSEIELMEVNSKIKWLDSEITKTSEEAKQYRVKLLKITKDIAENPEKQEYEYKEIYEKTNNLLLKMQDLESQYKIYFSRRDKLERDLKRQKEILADTEDLIQTITTSFRYLNDDLADIGNQLNQKEIVLLKIIESGENDKKNIARDIHDGPAQTLVFLTYEIQVLKKLIETMDLINAIKKVDEMSKYIHKVLEEIRHIIYDLRPMSLDDIGLIPTIENYIKEFNRSRGLSIVFDLKGDKGLIQKLPNTFSIAIFRIIQETLNNIYKHAEAKNVRITIKSLKNLIKLEISDDGKGFDVDKVLGDAKANGNFGLLGMMERVDLIGGDIDILSDKDRGTKINISIPLNFS